MQELMDRRVVRLLGGNLQPVELARAIGGAMERQARDGAVPNRFRLLVNPEDCADLRALDGSLETKLAAYAVELAREHGWNFAGPPQVQLVADAELERGRLEVEAGVEPGRVRRGAALSFEIATPDGLTLLPLDHFPFTIGRRQGHDLVLPDARVSRDHAAIDSTGSGYRLRDLGSRNGTLVNGQPLTEADLRDGDRLAIGGFEVTVRIAPAP